MQASIEVSPAEVTQLLHCAIVDIRPTSERRGAIGFIPGSVSVPLPAGATWAEILSLSYPGETLIVFACTSGKRSLEAAHRARSEGWARCRSLVGGVLGWRATGLPTCGVDEPLQVVPLPSREAFSRAMTSCFIAEATETQLDSNAYGEAFDPRGIVNRALAEHPVPSSRAALERALDRLAEIARQHGHGLDAIARNVDRMLAGIAFHP